MQQNEEYKDIDQDSDQEQNSQNLSDEEVGHQVAGFDQITQEQQLQSNQFIRQQYELFIYNYQQDRTFRDKVNTCFSITSLILAWYFFTIYISPECTTEDHPNQEECIDVIIQNLKSWVPCIGFTSITIFLILYKSVTKKIPKKNGVLALILFIYLVQFHYGPINLQSIGIRDYRSGHQIALIIMVTLLTIMSIYYKFIKYLFQKQKIIFYLYIGIQVFSAVYFTIAAITSCNSWNEGLVQNLDQSDNYCIIKQPKLCWPVLVDGIFDLSPDTCVIQENDRQNYIYQTLERYKIFDNNETESEKYQLSKDTKVLGWPLSNQNDVSDRVSEWGNQGKMIENLKIYNTVQEVFDDNREVAIDVQNLEMKFNIKRNATLVEEREKMATNQGISQNIIMIYLDTVSRPHFYRKLKKTAQFLKKFADYNSKEYENQNLSAKVFEFFRFHSIDRNTINNVFRMRYNTIQAEIRQNQINLSEKEKVQSTFNQIKEGGYIMAHATNSMSIKSTLRSYTHKGKPLHKFFQDDPADHEMFNFDPNYLDSSNIYGFKQGASSIHRRCLYGKDTSYYPFEYGKKFLDAYKDDKKFLLLEFTDGHEITSEVIRYVDDYLYDFLVDIEQKGYMSKDTIIYIKITPQNHGQHMISNYQPFELFYFSKEQANDVYTIERVLPMFFMFVTNDILKQQENLLKNLEENQQRIFGMDQYRQTLLANVYGNDNTNKQLDIDFSDNIFNELPIDRTCLDIKFAPLPDPYQYCSCLPQEGYFEGVKIRKEQKKLQNEKNKDL